MIHSSIPNATFLQLFKLFLGRLIRFRVKGDSMKPTLVDGDQVLVGKTKDVSVSDIVIANHPYKKLHIIKRVTIIDGDALFLVGDNNESADSTKFSFIKKQDVIGVTVAKL